MYQHNVRHCSQVVRRKLERCCSVGSLELQIGAHLAATHPDAHSLSDPLLSGAVVLPRDGIDADSSGLDLPIAVLSPGGCGRLFCSHSCAAKAWATWLYLLSPRTRSTLDTRIAESPYTVLFDIRHSSFQT